MGRGDRFDNREARIVPVVHREEDFISRIVETVKRFEIAGQVVVETLHRFKEADKRPVLPRSRRDGQRPFPSERRDQGGV
jgi:hypothetical protein